MGHKHSKSKGTGGSSSVIIGTEDLVLKMNIIEAKDIPAHDGNHANPFCVITFGGKTFRTNVAKKTLNPVWNQKLACLVTPDIKNGGVVFAVHDKEKIGSADFLGKTEIDTISKFSDGQVHNSWYDMTYVKDGKTTPAGQIHVSFQLLNRLQIETNFWKHIMGEFDTDHNGDLNKFELGLLFEGIGTPVSDKDLDTKFKELDLNHDKSISFEELFQYFRESTFEIAKARADAASSNRKLESEAEALWDIASCDDDVSSDNDSFVIGGFLTEASATRGFAERAINRVIAGEYNINKENGNIFVVARKTEAREEEKIPGFVRMGIRALYNPLDLDSSKILLKILKKMTISQGKAYDKPSSAKHIRPFIDFHQLNMDESLEPVENFKTFNEFFYRKLKKEARPIGEPENPKRAVSAADCRCMVFPEVSRATELWIKGKNFSLAGLLGDAEAAKRYEGGSMVIFRLAPQDYHRFHLPVNGVIKSRKPIDGEYYTVSPMAVRADVDVFTQNKRVYTSLESPEFGTIAFISVGATMVASIQFTKQVGDSFNKGDEYGFFAFGGSTCIAVFEKDKIKFDDDLVVNSGRPIETLIQMGEGIGVALS
jgi:phosphatidylserine decarboxylase